MAVSARITKEEKKCKPLTEACEHTHTHTHIYIYVYIHFDIIHTRGGTHADVAAGLAPGELEARVDKGVRDVEQRALDVGAVGAAAVGQSFG